MKKRIIKWLKILLLTYVLLGVAVYFFQDMILFHPVSLKPNYKYDFKQPHRDLTMRVDSESSINIIEFKTVAQPKGVVLYFHGNKKNIGWYGNYADNFTANGYEVWMIDYPGYGKSTGRFTENDLYNYAKALYQTARVAFSADSIVIYGKSMGTGIAAQLASTQPCRQLILETPYYSFVELGKHYLPIYPVEKMLHFKMPTNEYLQKINIPVIILHGTDDGIIPYSNATKLKPLLKPTDEFVTIEGGSHNDLNKYSLFHQKLDSLLR